MHKTPVHLGQIVSDSIASLKYTSRTPSCRKSTLPKKRRFINKWKAFVYQNLATQSRRCQYHDYVLTEGVARSPYRGPAHRPVHWDIKQQPRAFLRQIRKYSGSVRTQEGQGAIRRIATSSKTSVTNGSAPTPDSLATDVPLGQQVRKIMRHVAHPVGIVTSLSTGRSVPVGATISSFNTVSLEPDTVVSIHLKLPSSTYEAIQDSGGFNLHILREGKKGAFLADLFTKGNSDAAFQLLRQDLDYVPGQMSSSTATKFPKLIGKNSNPLENPVLSILECQSKDDLTVRVGDVAVVFGSVKAVHDYDRASPPDSGNRCLIYVDGTYGRPRKHHEGPRIQLAELRDMTEAVQAMHDSVQTVVTDLVGNVSKEKSSHTTTELSGDLRRLQWSLKSFEIFNTEIMKPFFERGSAAQATRTNGTEAVSPASQHSSSKARIPSGARSFSASCSMTQNQPDHHSSLDDIPADSKTEVLSVSDSQPADRQPLKRWVQMKALLR